MQPHPLFLHAIEILSIALVTGFTSSSSPLCIFILIFLSLSVWIAIPICTDHISRIPWAALVAEYLATFHLHYASTAVLSRSSFDNQGPTPINATSAERQGVKSETVITENRGAREVQMMA